MLPCHLAFKTGPPGVLCRTCTGLKRCSITSPPEIVPPRALRCVCVGLSHCPMLGLPTWALPEHSAAFVQALRCCCITPVPWKQPFIPVQVSTCLQYSCWLSGGGSRPCSSDESTVVLCREAAEDSGVDAVHTTNRIPAVIQE